MMGLFYEYVQLTQDVPPASSIDRKYVAVKARGLEVEDGHDDVEEGTEEVVVIPITEEEAVRLGLHISRENLQLYMSYDVWCNTWLVAYYPDNDMGFEVFGTSFEEVCYAAKVVLRSKIALALGDVESSLEMLDEENEYFITNRWGEEHSGEEE